MPVIKSFYFEPSNDTLVDSLYDSCYDAELYEMCNKVEKEQAQCICDEIERNRSQTFDDSQYLDSELYNMCETIER